jgi:hypothetical protein
VNRSMRAGVIACRPGRCHRFHCASESQADAVAETLTTFGYACTVLPEIVAASGVFLRSSTNEPEESIRS